MGGKGGGGGVSTNDQVVAMQQQQAAQAKAANEQRTARLGYGKNLIQGLFEGTPSGATPLDLSSITTSNAAKIKPQTISPIMNEWLNQNPSYDRSSLTQPSASSRQKLAGGYTWGVAPDTGAGTTYAIWDPQGNMVDEAATTSDLAAAKIYTGGDKTKTTGGFGDSFYDKYRQSIIDYYAPQEDQQYADARSDLAANLARAGQLDSSTAIMNIAKLSKQDALNTANIAAGADTQTGQLRSTVSQDEQSALNQLYSTEDPTVAANTAGNMVANANLSKPLLNPAGALFAPITVGVGNALTGFLNPAAYLNPGATGTATTASGNQSSGVPGAG